MKDYVIIILLAFKDRLLDLLTRGRWSTLTGSESSYVEEP